MTRERVFGGAMSAARFAQHQVNVDVTLGIEQRGRQPAPHARMILPHHEHCFVLVERALVNAAGLWRPGTERGVDARGFESAARDQRVDADDLEAGAR